MHACCYVCYSNDLKPNHMITSFLLCLEELLREIINITRNQKEKRHFFIWALCLLNH
jgi:hypothetical protein